MNRKLIGSTLGGTLGGALGTAFMQTGMQLSPKMPEKLRPPPVKQDPGQYMVERFEDRRGKALGPRAQRRAAKSLHWLYGMTWATLLGALAPRLGMSRLGRAVATGAALGAGVWATGYAGWLPRTGLTAPLRKQGASASASALISHIAYGVLAALPIFFVNRRLKRR